MLNRITSSEKRVTGIKDKIRYSDKAPGKGAILCPCFMCIYISIIITIIFWVFMFYLFRMCS